MVAVGVVDTLQGYAKLPADLIATVNALPAKILPPVLAQVDKHATRIEARVASIQGDARELATGANARVGDTLARVDDAIAQVKEIRGDLKPVLSGAATLEANYAALPAQIGAQVQPAWLAMEPEFTCRHADGTGYGGCWHSRFTGLFGEAERVGGVFTQQFPLLSASVTGIAADAHGFTKKYVMPHKLTLGDKFKMGGTIVLGLGSSALRGGVL